jgi:hypothetical protein
MGVDGGLPGGQAITYTVQGQAPQVQTLAVASQEEADWVRGFAMQLEAYNRAPAPDELVAILHPEILAVYGEAACLAHTEEIADATLEIEVVNVYAPDTWEFMLDGTAYAIPDVYTLDAVITRDGQSNNIQTHFGVSNGAFTWFTDCGEPLD